MAALAAPPRVQGAIMDVKWAIRPSFRFSVGQRTTLGWSKRLFGNFRMYNITSFFRVAFSFYGVIIKVQFSRPVWRLQSRTFFPSFLWCSQPRASYKQFSPAVSLVDMWLSASLSAFINGDAMSSVLCVQAWMEMPATHKSFNGSNTYTCEQFIWKIFFFFFFCDTR